MVDLEEFTLNKAKSMNINELRRIDNALSIDIKNQNKEWTAYLKEHPNTPLPNSLGHYDEYDRSNINELLENDINLQKLNSKYKRNNKRDLYLRIKRKQEYINNETFTIKGFENVKKQVRQRLRDLSGKNVKYTNRIVDIFWKAYNELTGHSDNNDAKYDIGQRRDILKYKGYSSQYDSNNFQTYLYDTYIDNTRKIKTYQDLLDLVAEDKLNADSFYNVKSMKDEFYR